MTIGYCNTINPTADMLLICKVFDTEAYTTVMSCNKENSAESEAFSSTSKHGMLRGKNEQNNTAIIQRECSV